MRSPRSLERRGSAASSMLPGRAHLTHEAVYKAPSCATQSLYIALSRFIGQSVAPRNILIPSRQGLRVLERLRRLCEHIGTPCPPSLPLPLWLQAKRQGTGWGAVGRYREIPVSSLVSSLERRKGEASNIFLLASNIASKCQTPPSEPPRVVSVSVSFPVSQPSHLVALSPFISPFLSPLVSPLATKKAALHRFLHRLPPAASLSEPALFPRWFPR